MTTRVLLRGAFLKAVHTAPAILAGFRRVALLVGFVVGHRRKIQIGCDLPFGDDRLLPLQNGYNIGVRALLTRGNNIGACVFDRIGPDAIEHLSPAVCRIDQYIAVLADRLASETQRRKARATMADERVQHRQLAVATSGDDVETAVPLVVDVGGKEMVGLVPDPVERLEDMNVARGGGEECIPCRFEIAQPGLAGDDGELLNGVRSAWLLVADVCANICNEVAGASF